jgi:diguanylate cyclase (GGDEF)-like protein/PAS domain S-box-containing protein
MLPVKAQGGWTTVRVPMALTVALVALSVAAATHLPVAARVGLISFALVLAALIIRAMTRIALTSARRNRRERVLVRDHAMMKSIVDGLSDAVLVKDLEGKLVWANPAALALIGAKAEDAIGHHARPSIFANSGTELHHQEQEVLRTTVAKTIELRSSDGARTFAMTHFPARSDGAITGVVAVAHEITAQRRDEESRLREGALLLQLGELLQMTRSLDEANQVVGEMLPAFFPQVAGKVCLTQADSSVVTVATSWGGLVCGDDVFSIDHCWALRKGQPHFAELGAGLRCKHCDSSAKTSWCLPMMANGEMLGILHLESESVLDEATRRRALLVSEHLAMALSNLRLAETLRHQSTRDPLTGLFNRRYTEETLERELKRAERSHEPVSVLMIDVDHFKRFNDTFGHDAGDHVLKELASVLNRRTRGSDVVSRMGGEELLVVLPGASQEVAARKADEIRAAIERLELLHMGKGLGAVTVSIGVSACPPHGASPTELLKIADQALYQAKRDGRNRVVVAEPEAVSRLRAVG